MDDEIGTYVDVKSNNQDWCVGRILEKDKDFVTIRLDGMLTKNDQKLRHNSIRIAPFRRYTRGYTGYPKTLRDDPRLQRQNIEQVHNMVKAFMAKDFRTFDPKILNQNLRGIIYMFTDTLLARKDNEIELPELIHVYQFLNFMLGFATLYLKDFPKLFSPLNEGINNPEALANNNETIYAHFIFELIELLQGIMGLATRCNKLYELDITRAEYREIIKVFGELKNITVPVQLPPPQIKQKEATEDSQDLNDDSNQVHSENSDHLDEEIMGLVFANLMIDKFASLHGFKYLLNIIYPDSSESEQEMLITDDKGAETATESESSPVKKPQNHSDVIVDNVETQNGSKPVSLAKASRAVCPWILIDRIVRIFEQLDKKLVDETKLDILAELRQRIGKRVQNIRDKEIKELDIDIVKKVFDRLERMVLELHGDENENTAKFHEFKEKSELELYFRFLDSQSFEKKLKGLNGIKDYATNRIDVEEGPQDDATAARKPLYYFTNQRFVKWILDNKVIEIIYEKHTHIELIKRSVDLLKFLTKHCNTFPDKLINSIWNSSLDKHEDVVKVIYEKIIELGPELDLDAAQKMYEKFLTVRVEDYTEDFIDLISRFTKNCLTIVVKKDEDGSFKVMDVSEEQKKHHYFGVSFLFNLALDNSPLELDLSQKVLLYLQDIITDFPIPNIFLGIINECLKNLAQDQSVYQSLVVMKRFIMTIRDINAYQSFCDVYFPKIAIEHNLIEYLVKDIKEYWHKVQERIRAYRGAMREETAREEGLIDESFVGKFSHRKNIFERLYALRDFVLYIYPDDPLDTEQVRQLWKVFVLEPNFAFETNEFLRLISTVYTVNRKMVLLVKLEDLKSFLFEILCNEDMLLIDQLTVDKFTCLEFFFICVNMNERRVAIDQKDVKADVAINSHQIEVINQDLFGLAFLWKCLERCPDSFLVDQFTSLLVNIYTRLHQSLLPKAHEIHQKLVMDLIESIQGFLDQRNVRGIERFIQFLGKLFDRLDGRRENSFPRSAIHAGHYQSQMHKVTIEAQYDPYGVRRKLDFLKKERVGVVKETLARHFEVDSGDFDLFIDDAMMLEDDLYKELKDVYNGNPLMIAARLIKRDPRPNQEDPKYLLTQHRNYLDIFFRIFSTFEPEKLKTIWDFAQKLPLQEDIKQEFFDRKDFTHILEDESSLSDSNIYRFYYYLSIINHLSISDPYFNKIKNIDIQTVKTEWASQFVVGGGLNSLIGLINSTDFNQINNFLFLKTILLLFKTIKYYDIAFEEIQREMVNSGFLLKSLDVLLYSSQYINHISGDISLQYEIIKDHTSLCQSVCDILIRSLQNNPDSCQDFLNYGQLTELFMSLFINATLDNSSQFDGQNYFVGFLNELIETLGRLPSPQKKQGEILFKLIFENMIFAVLKSQCMSYALLKFVADFLSKYNLKHHFECDLDIFNIMTELVQYIKHQQHLPTGKNMEELKIEACFYILQQYLHRNQHYLQFFGQDLGLVSEILSNGIFKIPSLDKSQAPKYTNKTLIKRAFDMLSLLSMNEANFTSAINFLHVIHILGLWRNCKPSSWNLYAHIKRRSIEYSGLKNLGCTCYMNSTLQQLYMIPTFRKYLPKLIDPTFDPEESDENMLFQLKRLFYGMQYVDKEYFSPKKFCISFKDIDGSPTNFNEQKDASEFLSLFMDRFEEQIKGTPHADFMKVHFGGLLSNELICKECPHHYDREEPLLAINLPVKNKRSIIDSLESFIEGEILDGDNAYYCEECKMKVKTVKRVSIKKLPNYLIFTLKRFEYDFDMNARVKVNDYCEFPLELNMEPFTQQHLKKMERPRKATTDELGLEASQSRTMSERVSADYNLKGVVVHLGVADSGHYYSIIRETNDDQGNKKDVWLEFNDTRVTEFNIKGLPDITFGEREGHSSYQSAFMLVYERKNIGSDMDKCEEEFEKQEKQRTQMQEERRKKQDTLKTNYELNGNGNGETSMEVEGKATSANGEAEGEEEEEKKEETEEEKQERFFKSYENEVQAFKEVEDEVFRKNSRIFYIANVFSQDYIKFVFSLIQNYESSTSSNSEEGLVKASSDQEANTVMEEEEMNNKGISIGKAKNTLQILFNFVCSVYFTTIVRSNDKKQQYHFFEWISQKMESDIDKCQYILNHFSNYNFFNEMIFQCPNPKQRKCFVSMVLMAFTKIFERDVENESFEQRNNEGYPMSSSSNFISLVMNQVIKVKSYLKQMNEYFSLVQKLMQINDGIVNYMLNQGFLGRLSSLIFYDFLSNEEYDELQEPLLAIETDVELQYNDDITREPRRYKEADFAKPSLSDLTSYFRIMWELLTYTVMEDNNKETFRYKKTAFEYLLTPLESKIFTLDKEGISDLFAVIHSDNKNGRSLICKIISYSCHGNLEVSKQCLKYIQSELKDDKYNKRSAEYFKLIQVMLTMDDEFRDQRNDIIIDNFITHLNIRIETPFSVDFFIRFLRKLIVQHDYIAEKFKDRPDKCDKVIKVLAECVNKYNNSMSEPTTAPVNYNAAEAIKKMLIKHIQFFTALKDEQVVNLSPMPADEETDTEPEIYHKGQKVEYYDETSHKYLPAVIEAVYDRIVKVKVNDSYCEWMEDDSKDLRPKEETVEQEIKSAVNQETSPTQYCSSPGELSYRSNRSNRSNNSPQRSPTSLDTQANI